MESQTDSTGHSTPTMPDSESESTTVTKSSGESESQVMVAEIDVLVKMELTSEQYNDFIQEVAAAMAATVARLRLEKYPDVDAHLSHVLLSQVIKI